MAPFQLQQSRYPYYLNFHECSIYFQLLTLPNLGAVLVMDHDTKTIINLYKHYQEPVHLQMQDTSLGHSDVDVGPSTEVIYKCPLSSEMTLLKKHQLTRKKLDLCQLFKQSKSWDLSMFRPRTSSARPSSDLRNDSA